MDTWEGRIEKGEEDKNKRGGRGGGGIFFFKQKTACEMQRSDWSSDVCSSDPVTACRTGLPSIT